MSRRASSAAARAEIEVKPTYGLTDEQVESMILDSFDTPKKTSAKRLLIEARNEAETILIAKMEKALIAVKSEDDYQAHSQSHRRAQPGHNALGRVNDGQRGHDRAERQNHGRSRYGRRPHRSASHGESRV
jgi:molecular chaperone DnaK (HSP70)